MEYRVDIGRPLFTRILQPQEPAEVERKNEQQVRESGTPTVINSNEVDLKTIKTIAIDSKGPGEPEIGE